LGPRADLDAMEKRKISCPFLKFLQLFLSNNDSCDMIRRHHIKIRGASDVDIPPFQVTASEPILK
jgi:hypothetical protein